MARDKFQILTEQMFYILMCLFEERNGAEIAETVKNLSDGRVLLSVSTLYTILGDFEKGHLIKETKVEGRKRSYLITEAGKKRLYADVKRMETQLADYDKATKE